MNTSSIMNRSILLSVACLLGTALGHAKDPSADAFFFQDGDRAMILGDSITQGRTYPTLMESYVLSRFPTWKISFRNTGWSGDTMNFRTRGGLDKGYDRDIKDLKATAVTIDFGMNDARAADGGLETYLTSARTLADKFAADGARVAFITSSPEERYQEKEPAGSSYNLMLRKYSDGLKGVAGEKKLLFVDQLGPMIEVIESGRKANQLSVKEGGVRLIPDGVHPGMAGGWIMAATILKGLHAPALVSSVELDATTGKVLANKATVSEVKTEGGLSFTRLDEAMPWPVPPDALMAAKIPGFTPFDDLSRYELKVTHLTAPKYEVSVDGKAIGTFTREELAKGVNFSELAQKAFPETGELFNAIKKKNDLYYSLWREVKLGIIPDWVPKDVVESAREKKTKELEEALIQAEDAVNKVRAPKPHQWALAPAA